MGGQSLVFCPFQTPLPVFSSKKLTEKNQPSGMPKRGFREANLEEIAEAIVFLEAINDPYYSALLGGLYDLFLVLKKTRYLFYSKEQVEAGYILVDASQFISTNCSNE